MRFCPKCGSMLREQRKGASRLFVCAKCGFSEQVDASASKNNAGAVPVRKPGATKGVIDFGEIEDSGMPKTRAQCPKCGNLEAYWWMQQTRSGDEASTRFFRCTKCSHTWREYE
ncbi:MAG: transcription factor S [Thermoprotei archaeon]